MANKILTQFKQKINSLELEPSSGGCFELTADGQLIYSKLKTDAFPDEDAMLTAISDRMK